MEIEGAPSSIHLYDVIAEISQTGPGITEDIIAAVIDLNTGCIATVASPHGKREYSLDEMVSGLFT
jgi:hypothetical protein